MTTPSRGKGRQPKPYVDYAAQREDARAIERMLYEIRYQDDFAFLTEPAKPRRHNGKSSSQPGRLCQNCRAFVSGQRAAPCPECGSTK